MKLNAAPRTIIEVGPVSAIAVMALLPLLSLLARDPPSPRADAGSQININSAESAGNTELSAPATINLSVGAIYTNSIGMEFVPLPSGYWVGVYEVTQAEYEQVMQHNPSQFKGGRLPVDSVSWNEAMSFCRKLTELDRQAGRLPEGYAYTLPTQQQWEYFVVDARLGDAVTSQTGKRISTMPVGALRPNRYGLYDARKSLGMVPRRAWRL